LLATLKSTRKDVKEQLAGVKKDADDWKKKPSPHRHDATKEFYELVSTINFESLDELIETDAAIKQFQNKWFR
jgi:hypothetical protein